MSGLVPPRGASRWPEAIPLPRRGRYEVPEWVYRLELRLYRTSHAEIMTFQYKGRDFTFSPETVADYRLNVAGTPQIRWALLDGAWSLYARLTEAERYPG